MNHPTREEFDALAEEVRKLKEQHTEPMKVVLEQRPTEGEVKLLETLLRQSGQQATDIGALQHDVSVLQKMTAEGFMDIRKRFDAIASIQKQILEKLDNR